jgi:hypothetical protein
MNCSLLKFKEWLAMREGLWLADKNAVAGMSRIDPLAAGPTKAKTVAAKSRMTPRMFQIGRKPKIAPITSPIRSLHRQGGTTLTSRLEIGSTARGQTFPARNDPRKLE